MLHKILVVDGHLGVCRLIKDVLIGEGYDVCICPEPLKALEIVQNDRFSLILLDVRIRGVDCWDLYHRIRAFCQGTIVLMASSVNLDQVVTAHENGVVDYFMKKPFDIKDLRKLVKALTGQQENCSCGP
ncbi:response regulator [Candidatus Formimonas warabiya]|uniref:Stage 0 sporulation protein A homolog n=1 Tax=Formimonas warabiya TaxID=1761012 RepID=A0A3G1KU48_FORW1|nr:response regulator [Candidatus Formimonas warabiya]ATW26033.1 hypothetical protein DCMF_15750 [Candidatus Formimonas warabiya]